MWWLVVGRLFVVKVAVSAAVAVSGRVALTTAVTKKVTVPVGLATALVPGLTIWTVAVKVTVCPETGGLTDGTTVVVVSALLTTKGLGISGTDWGLGLKFLSAVV